MKERPILFSAPMVRALLDGSKTQTRRILKQNPNATKTYTRLGMAALCPYGQAGDRLWVREAHSIGPGPGVILETGEIAGSLRRPHVTYSADDAIESRETPWRGAFGVSRPSIHMPRWACRLVLEITSVRVERLQDISEADAKAEGVEWLDHPATCAANQPARGWRGYVNYKPLYRDTARESFESLWSSINGSDSWAGNPWVWALTFQKVEP